MVWINPEEHKIVGTVLADFRKSKGVTQKDLSAQLGKPQSFVSSYETGQRRLDILELIRIAKTLNVDARQIFAAILDASAR